MPPEADINREFYKGILNGEKKLIKISAVMFINVPKLPELSVRKIIDQVKDKNTLLPYIPSNFDKKRTICREWFYNIINTVFPGWLGRLISFS